MVIEAHYHRNPKAPSLEIYASHWLWARTGKIDEKVMNLLISQYPLPTKPKIEHGYTDWNGYGKYDK